MQMTFDNYDKMIENFNKIESDTCWPSREALEKMEVDLEKYIPFLCFLLEKGVEPKNEEEKENKRYLNKLINENLELID